MLKSTSHRYWHEYQRNTYAVFWSWYKEMSGTPPEKQGLLRCQEEWFPEWDTWCFCIICTQVQSCMGKPCFLDNIPLSGLFLPLITPKVKGLVNLTPLLKHLTLSCFDNLKLCVAPVSCLTVHVCLFRTTTVTKFFQNCIWHMSGAIKLVSENGI